MLIVIEKLQTSTLQAREGIIISTELTDFRFEHGDWTALIDTTLPSSRVSEIRNDAVNLIKLVKKHPKRIENDIFENIFGGHYTAFLFNRLTSEVNLFRDISGTKSAYYAQTSKEFVVGTNMHQVADRVSKKDLSLQSASHLITGGYLFDGETFYYDVHELPMGSHSSYKPDNTFKINHIYELGLSESENNLSQNLNVKMLRNSILQAHESRIGDENIVLLSGGIDSSVMLCSLREVVGRTKVRALTFRVKGTDEDETVYAVSLARHLNIEIDIVEVDPNNKSLIDNFEKDIINMNSPYFGRFIFGQFNGAPNQVYFAGQDTRLHTPDINFLDMIALNSRLLESLPFIGSHIRFLANVSLLLKSFGFSVSKNRWKRGLFRGLVALDLDEYINRFFFKINPEKLRLEGYSDHMVIDLMRYINIEWTKAKNNRHLYNLIIAKKWGEQYTSDMRYLQDLAFANRTHVALPFYDINLARFSSNLPFNQSTKSLIGLSKYGNKRAVVNKVLLREAFRSELNETVLMRAKAVSRSQHLLFTGVLGRKITDILKLDRENGQDSLVSQLGLDKLVSYYFSKSSYSPEDEELLTKIYWLSIMSFLKKQKQ